MPHILPQAQALLGLLLSLMPSSYQGDSLQALLALFLQAQGYPLPQHCPSKSPSALSRFLNHYDWPTRLLIRSTRRCLLQTLLDYRPRGRRPHLQVIIDLTCLEKRGKFAALPGWVRVFHGKRGLQMVMLYLVVGVWRCPWGFRVYRGQGTLTPVQLALRLLRTLPQELTTHYEVMVLADAGFGSTEFLRGVRCLGLHALVGVGCQRTLQDGRSLKQLPHCGSQVKLKGWSRSVWAGWYWFERQDGRRLQRFGVCTRRLKGSTLRWWGKRRWQIEGWFKVAKHRFGLARFGQSTLLGVYRWLVLSLIAFILAHWGYLLQAEEELDWKAAAQRILELLLPQVVLTLLIKEIERLRPLAQQQGLDFQILGCKI